MASTKRLSVILFLGLTVLWSTILAAEEGRSSYPGHIGMYNPCNNAVVMVDGTNYVRIHQNAREHDDAHVTIHLRFVGTGQDQIGNPYRTVLTAKGDFQTDASSYDVPYRSLWVGEHGAPSFSMDGTLRVWVESGAAIADNIMTYNTVCRKDLRSDEHDRDWHEDRDHDSHEDHNRE